MQATRRKPDRGSQNHLCFSDSIFFLIMSRIKGWFILHVFRLARDAILIEFGAGTSGNSYKMIFQSILWSDHEHVFYKEI
jgi:hypothetical protein